MASTLVDLGDEIYGYFPFWKAAGGTLVMSGSADRFWLELQDLYAAARKPSLKRLVHLGLEQSPPISVSHSTINGWLNRKAVPMGRKSERYLMVMVAFLQAQVRPDTRYERLPPGEWGRLLLAAQDERTAEKKHGRPRHGRIQPQGADARDESRQIDLSRPNVRGGQQLSAGVNAVGKRDHWRSAATPSALFGRDSELALLTGLVKSAAAGLGGAVLIEGEPGIGKSALVQVALTQALDAGCQVFWGSGDELGRELPLIPLLDGLGVREPSGNPRSSVIARLLCGEASVSPGADVTTVVAEHLLAFVAEQCAVEPVILVVDDLQWADRSSLLVWQRLARSARQMPLLLVGTLRPVPLRDDLLPLRRTTGTAQIRLAGLTETAVAELVASLVGGQPDSSLLQLVSEAAGNPLYITELVAALTRGSKLAVSPAGTVTLTSGSTPGSLSGAVADRISFVSSSTREVLQTAAMLGADFAVTDLAIVLGRRTTDLFPALGEARSAGVLAEQGESLRFRHPLIRAALYDDLPAPVRAAWHRDAAQALAEASAPPDRVARHLLRADGEHGDMTRPVNAWMLTWLTGAADLLVGQAPGVAAELLARAVVGSPAKSAQRAMLTSRLADALYRVGDRESAERTASQALEYVVEPDLFTDLHWTLAQCRMLAGSYTESLATLHEALAAPGISSRHRARLLVLAARTQSSLGDVEKAGQVANNALAAAMEAADNWAMGWALLMMALVHQVQGHATDALPLFDRALSVTKADPALIDIQLLLQINKAIMLGCLDQYEDAFAVAAQARRLADQVGTAIRLAQAHGALCQLFFETGRWDNALAEAAAVPLGLKGHDAACGELGAAAVISFHRGDVTAARRDLASAEPHAKRIGHRLIGPLALARSLDHEHAGRFPEALAVLTAGLSNSEELGEVENLFLDAARLAMRIGDVRTAQRLADRAAELASELEVPHRYANALYCRGLLNHDAVQLLDAAERYGEACWPLSEAKALEAAAGQLLRAEDHAEVRITLMHALDVYTSMRADADIKRLEADMRAG